MPAASPPLLTVVCRGKIAAGDDYHQVLAVVPLREWLVLTCAMSVGWVRSAPTRFSRPLYLHDVFNALGEESPVPHDFVTNIEYTLVSTFCVVIHLRCVMLHCLRRGISSAIFQHLCGRGGLVTLVSILSTSWRSFVPKWYC